MDQWHSLLKWKVSQRSQHVEPWSPQRWKTPIVCVDKACRREYARHPGCSCWALKHQRQKDTPFWGSQERHRYGWKTQPRTPKGSGIRPSRWTKTWLSVHVPAGQQQQATGSTCLAIFNLSMPGCNHYEQYESENNQTNYYFFIFCFL